MAIFLGKTSAIMTGLETLPDPTLMVRRGLSLETRFLETMISPVISTDSIFWSASTSLLSKDMRSNTALGLSGLIVKVATTEGMTPPHFFSNCSSKSSSWTFDILILFILVVKLRRYLLASAINWYNNYMKSKNVETALRFKWIVITVVTLIGTGSIFYHIAMKLKWLDAIYFSVITLTTVGYGDIHPTNDISKIFTIFYVLIGVGIIASTLSLLVRVAAERRIQNHRNNQKSKK